jgi:DNA-binding MarR family transcriptional regulator
MAQLTHPPRNRFDSAPPRARRGSKGDGRTPNAHIARATLDLLERRRLSAGELKILLALANQEMTIFELAVSLDQHTAVTRRTGARLYARGLVHWRDVRARAGSRGTEPLLRITEAGRLLLRPLIGWPDRDSAYTRNGD